MAESVSMEETLIPGLPEEVVMLCLARLPFRYYPLLSCVCRSWRRALQLPLLFHIRSQLGLQEHFVFVMVYEKPTQPPSSDSTLCYLIDCRVAKCYPLPPLPRVLCSPYILFKVIALGRQVFISPERGGLLANYRGWSPDCPQSRALLCFDVVSRRWGMQSPPMLEKWRSCFASATVDGYVYAAGGHDHQGKRLKSVERFDLASKKWERVPDMREERHVAKGVVWKGSFCVLGGRRYGNHLNWNDAWLNSAEVWDALKEEWQLIPDFVPFGTWDAATVKGKLYAIKDSQEKLLMYLDEKRKRWFLLGSLEDAFRGYANGLFQGQVASGTMMEVGDELWTLALVHKAAYKCAFFATDPESRPLCWKILPCDFYTCASRVCVVTL